MIAQMTLRNIPDRVAKGLRAKARKSGCSINRTTVELLQQALGESRGNTRKRDLSHLAGQWDAQECREFEQAIKRFEQVDDEVWRT